MRTLIVVFILLFIAILRIFVVVAARRHTNVVVGFDQWQSPPRGARVAAPLCQFTVATRFALLFLLILCLVFFALPGFFLVLIVFFAGFFFVFDFRLIFLLVLIVVLVVICSTVIRRRRIRGGRWR
jgi:hypothetical protein